MRRIKKGFTLAEVLITLAIIGVVAAIVMPSVIASYQLKTVGVKLAKFAGTIENSARAYTASNGAFSQATIGTDGATANADIINNFLADSLVIKSIYDTDSAAGKTTSYSTSQYKGLVIDKSKIDKTSDHIVVAKATKPTGEVTDSTAEGKIAVLKDNTKVIVYPIDAHTAASDWKKTDSQNVNKNNVGEGAFIIAFDPAVNGLPSAKQKVYNFVVTESGFVFPAADDKCAWAIYNNDWNSTSAIMDDTANSCTKAATSGT